MAAPETAQYVTLATDSTLTAERVLTAGEHVALTDGGAGSTVTVDVDPIWLMTCMVAVAALLGSHSSPKVAAGFIAWFFENVSKTGLDTNPAVEAVTQLDAFLGSDTNEGHAARDSGAGTVVERALQAIENYTTDAGSATPS